MSSVQVVSTPHPPPPTSTEVHTVTQQWLKLLLAPAEQLVTSEDLNKQRPTIILYNGKKIFAFRLQFTLFTSSLNLINEMQHRFFLKNFLKKQLFVTEINLEQNTKWLTEGNDTLTNNHESELKTFLHRLAMNLIGKVGEPNITWRLRVGELSLLWKNGKRRKTRFLSASRK